jgi:aminodeoxyfutalosine synthase
MEWPDLLALGSLANALCERLHKKQVFYNHNLHLNVTNICESQCRFCSFSRPNSNSPGAYCMTVDQALDWISERCHPKMTEIHIVNGLNRSLPFTFYLELISRIKKEFPFLHIKAFTAVEIDYFSNIFRMSYEAVLRELAAVGVGSLPGGGAEIFSSRVRQQVCPNKVDAEGWLEIHRIAHSFGIKSNCTMLYGTVETPGERIDHLLKLRDLQDETVGFQCFLPLRFHSAGNSLALLGSPTAVDDLRMVAVSRLILHNVPNIKAYWIMLGVKTAQTALLFGANDLDGTVTAERIYHMAGSHSPESLSVEQIRKLITAAGRIPVERSSLYQPIAAEEALRASNA